VLTTYTALLRRPGTLRFSSAGFVMRLPLSMLGLGVVLFLTLTGSSYTVAAAVSAAGALANAFIGPLLSRYIDRYTQHRMLPWLVAVAVAFQVAFIAAVLLDLPLWTWFVAFCIGEAFVPNVGSLVRARWAHVLDEPSDVRTAFALESVVDEVVFVTGPPLATALAVSFVAWGAVGASIALLILGTVLLVPLRATEPPPASPEHHDGPAAFRYPGILGIVAVFLLVGGMFGAFEVATVASAEALDARVWTGALLAAYALGSGVAGLVLGARHLAAPLPVQFRLFLTALAVVSLPFPFLGSAAAIGVFGFLAGLAVAPTLITGFALVERLVPSGRLTEGLTVVFAGLTVGFAFGASASGPVIDSFGASTAYWLLVGCAGGAAVIGWVGGRRLDRALARADEVSAQAAAAPDPA